MKKTLKKSKKIIILSVILLALFCLNAFKSAHFTPAPTVSAEETREQTTTYINLTKSGVVNYWAPVYRGQNASYTYWSTINASGDNGVISSRTVNGYTIKNFYSSHTGEKVCIIPSTTISIGSYLEWQVLNDDTAALVIAIKNKTLNTTTYVVDIFDAAYADVLEIGKYNIDGTGFPNVNDENFGKYELLAIQLLTVDEDKLETVAGYYSNIFQPIFNLYTNAYKDYYAIFTNASVLDYNLNSSGLLRFSEFYGQITDLDNSAVTTGTGVPVQNGYATGLNDYKIEFQAKSAQASAYIHNASADGNILYIASGSSVLQKKDNSTYTNYATAAGFSWTPATNENAQYMSISTTEDGDAISLKTASNALSTVLQNFNILLKTTTQETPEPEPEPEPEQEQETQIDYNKVVDRAREKIRENLWWITLIGITVGPAATLIPTALIGADAAVYGAGITGGFGEIVKYVVTHPFVFFRALLTAIGTAIKEFFKEITNQVFGGNNLLFIIVLIVVVLIFIGRDGSIIYYIKNKKE